MKAPSSTTEILDLAFDMEANEVIIGGVRFKPCGAGTAHKEVAYDDARAAFDALVKLRNECFNWRYFAVKLHEWIGRMPHEPKVQL